ILKKNKLLKNIAAWGSALSMLLPSAPYAKAPAPEKAETVKRAEEILEDREEFPLGEFPAPVAEKYSLENTLDDVISLLYPSSGRFKWVFGMGDGRWGKHKVTPKKFDWKKYETKSFEVLSYDPELAREFGAFGEEWFEKYAKRFDLHKFDHKNIVVLYNTRADFEQTRLWPGLVPEGLGGFTFTRESDKHLMSWLFEGSKRVYYMIGAHEMHHRFSIEKLKEVDAMHSAKHEFPVWLEEGGAEYGAVGWDASSEMIIRDAYHNDYFVPIEMMDYILGTWLMYKEGQFVSKVIAEKFGKDKLLELRKNTRLKNFGENVKATLGITFSDLSHLVMGELDRKYSSRRGERDFVAKADLLGEGTVMAHEGDIFVIGEHFNKKHPDEDKLYLVHMGKDKRFSKEIERDHDLNKETLHWLANGAALDADTVAYGVRNNEGDVLKLRDFNVKGDKFKLGRAREYRFPDIEIIKHPEFVGEDLFFVGYDKKGYGDMYRFHEKTGKLERLTRWKKDINSVDFSRDLGKFVVSVEDHEKGLIGDVDYNHNLYLADKEFKTLEKLTETPENETKAGFSPDGKEIIFTSDAGDEVDLYVMDLESKKRYRVSRSKIGAFGGSFVGKDEVVFHSLKMMDRKMHRTKIPSLESLAREEGWKSERAEKKWADLRTKDGSLFINEEKVLKSIITDRMYIITGKSTYAHDGGSFKKLGTEEKTLDDVLAKVDNVIASDVSADGERLAIVKNNILSFDAEYPVSVALMDKGGKTLWEYGIKIKPKSTHAIRDVHALDENNVVLEMTGGLIAFNKDGHKALTKKMSGVSLFGMDGEKLAGFAAAKEKGYAAAILTKGGEANVLIYQDGKSEVHSLGKVDEVRMRVASDGDVVLASSGSSKFAYRYDAKEKRLDKFKVDGKGSITHIDTVGDEIVASLSVARKTKKTALPTLERIVAISPAGKNTTLLEGYRKIANFRNAEGKLFFDAFNPGVEETYSYNGTLSKAVSIEDADLNEDYLLLSDKEDLILFDLKDGKTKRVENIWGFSSADGTVSYLKKTSDGMVKHTLDLEGLETESRFPFPMPTEELKLAMPKLLEDKEPKIAEKKLSRLPFFKNRFSGYGAWSGGLNLFVAADYTGKDVLEDHAVNISVFGSLQSYMVGRALYADLDKGYNLSAYFNKFGRDFNAGTSAGKVFPINKYLQLDMHAGYMYAHIVEDLFDFYGDSHVLKAGFGVGFDTTKWGVLGPKEGVKFFVSSETGFSANRLNVSNIDFNSEVRYYVNIFDTYLSLAFRAAGGTSMGEMPTLYRMGGNTTLRGTPFGSDWGNNYILGSAEARLNLIEIGGLLLRKPLTGMSAFTLFPAIEIGWYVDAGDAWYDNPWKGHSENGVNPFEFKYSSGFMVNVPTMYGMVLRFSKGVVGEKNFNFWFGVDF
ncbi:PD40 domain-containing protein, partial [Candidatus Woesearchaeota archaeon]|nr:PD40 domain-containing protein [Candidatus Woesearchaeota archaeon]